MRSAPGSATPAPAQAVVSQEHRCTCYCCGMTTTVAAILGTVLPTMFSIASARRDVGDSGHLE